ncbi:MAG: insulinase family protein, partial [Deltaproteobacteria bacterium]|nr:insulinase family protein [Deltaproteobacteria bacterium]
RDFDQSTIVMGHLGPQRLHPDMYDLAVYDKYFGDGAWGSLLFSEIRSKLGLAYSIYGDFSGGPVAGTYAIALQTRNAEALNAVERVKDLVIKSATDMAAPSAYEEAKHQINRSFVFKFPNARSVVERNAILELLKYPKDFDSSYLDKIAAVTSASSLAAAKRHVKPSDLVIVIVGNVSPQEVRRRFGGKLRVYSLNFDHAPHVDNHFPVE